MDPVGGAPVVEQTLIGGGAGDLAAAQSHGTALALRGLTAVRFALGCGVDNAVVVVAAAFRIDGRNGHGAHARGAVTLTNGNLGKRQANAR